LNNWANKGRVKRLATGKPHFFTTPNRLLLLATCLMLGLGSCQSESNKTQFSPKGREVPRFSKDTAYHFIERQVSFGPRNPGSEGHQKALNFLYDKLSSYAGSRFAYRQSFTHRGYNGDTLQLTNVIASFNPEAADRILLCAHWDTRPRADHADKNKDQPILGANDGGSGVGVLLELARLFKQKEPPVGVDIVLFDGEDYGKTGDQQHYFLGSRYWANHPPVKDYHPRFGILVDIVGGENAQFLQEQISLAYAPGLVNEVWAIAHQKDYQSIFPDREGAQISDDHVIINRILNIPTINIIDHRVRPDGGVKFPEYWHTHRDRMEIIDRNTLHAVGTVLTELIYNRL